MEKIRFIPKNNAVHDIYAKIGVPFPAGLTSGNTQSAEYLYVENITDYKGVMGILKIGGNNPDISYSFDKETWTSYSSPVDVEPHVKIYLKGVNENGFSTNYDKYTHINVNFNANTGGDITSLLFGNDFKDESEVELPTFCFWGLFGETKIVSASELDFSRITFVDDSCFGKMFAGNDLFVNPPRLDKMVCTTYSNRIPFSQMFRNCQNLATVYYPTIPFNNVICQNWLDGVAANGVLYADSSVIDGIWTNSANGCPSGWTKQTI